LLLATEAAWGIGILPQTVLGGCFADVSGVLRNDEFVNIFDFARAS
jgi:hypothetical protein